MVCLMVDIDYWGGGENGDRGVFYQLLGTHCSRLPPRGNPVTERLKHKWFPFSTNVPIGMVVGRHTTRDRHCRVRVWHAVLKAIQQCRIKYACRHPTITAGV